MDKTTTKQIDEIAKMFIGHSIEEMVDLHAQGKTDSEIIRSGQQKIEQRRVETDLKNLFGK